jgi:CubicO group peptidase (beta-lactamase class C family)
MRHIIKSLVFCISIYSSLNAQNNQIIDSRISEQLDNAFSTRFKNEGIGCATLIAKNGKIIYKKAFGMADLELNVAMTTDHVFRIGSITKQFTAVAILQLMEKGLLKLNDNINKFIPDYPEYGRSITIENLLTHTSGIKNLTEIKDLEVKKNPYTLEELMNVFKNQPTDFPPGTKYLYSNSGYIMLGAIIEKVSGMTYEQYLSTNIFKPLKMNNSYYDNPAKIIKNRARGYVEVSESEAINAEYLNTSFPYSAGALLMTVEDLFIWQKALLSNKLLKNETRQLAQTPYTLKDGTKTNYGFGWELSEIYGSKTIQHTGSITGFASMEMYLPDEDVFIVTLSNGINKNSIAATNLAACFITNKAIVDDILILDEIADSYVGLYTLNPDKPPTTRIFKENGKLYLRDTRASRPWQMHFNSNTDFVCYEVFPNNHIFIKDSEGKVMGFVIKAPSYESRLTKTE